MQYQTIFFDLDHTLWDYETNSRETLVELYDQFNLLTRGVENIDQFHLHFREVNLTLWEQYDTGKIGSEVIRKERFKRILERFNAYDSTLSDQLSTEYLSICPAKCNLMPHAIDTLQYLSTRYSLTVITNGFEEIQKIKLKAGNLLSYFDHIITSQMCGYKKPAKEIFDYALSLHKTPAARAMMVGDNLITDIGGALNASIAGVYYNPDQLAHSATVSHEIQHLRELRTFL